MTGDNRLANAAEERRFANRFLAAAGALAAAELWDRALAQLYFALLHAARGLLLTEGLDPRSHKAVRRLTRGRDAGRIACGRQRRQTQSNPPSRYVIPRLPENLPRLDSHCDPDLHA